MKYSYETKQSVLVNGQVKEYVKSRKALFKGDSTLYEDFIDVYGDEITKVCKSVSDSKYRKRINIEKRFKEIVESGNAIFLTLTFTDEALSKTKPEIRRKYVQRFLKDQCSNYVANIDYGDKVKNPDSNEREHYHALVMVANGGNIDMSKWLYGFVLCKRVHKSIKDTEKVAKYVSKLSQHALKECCRVPRLIWSRGWKK